MKRIKSRVDALEQAHRATSGPTSYVMFATPNMSEEAAQQAIADANADAAARGNNIAVKRVGEWRMSNPPLAIVRGDLWEALQP